MEGGDSEYHDVTYNKSDYDQSRLDCSYSSPAICRLLVNGMNAEWRRSAVALNCVHCFYDVLLL